ncbi:MAG: hypothetical protein OXI90_17080 [Gammaproteobacteria bacterium]|nr:hypothetical protein [Gammaproteobacteria bacterium]
MLRELIAATIREAKELPEPSPARSRRPLIVPPVEIALKAALYEACRQAGISQRRFARDVENDVRRLLNPGHGTKTATLDRGKQLSVRVGDAALSARHS